MKKFGVLREKIPFLALLSCCVVVLAISGAVKSAEESKSTMAEASGKQVILLDAGHGGIDSGGIGINGVYEKDINLSIVKNLGSLLTLSGYDVVYTRTEDISIYDNGVEGIRNQKVSDMENRLEIVERYPESIFLSLCQV